MSNTENNQDLHDFYRLIFSLGGTKEDIVELWKIGLDIVGRMDTPNNKEKTTGLTIS